MHHYRALELGHHRLVRAAVASVETDDQRNMSIAR
jgi:hypothetical protein